MIKETIEDAFIIMATCLTMLLVGTELLIKFGLWGIPLVCIFDGCIAYKLFTLEVRK